MKKRKLRTWVKVAIVLLGLGILLLIDNINYNNAVNDCVNAGHSQNYCESGLR